MLKKILAGIAFAAVLLAQTVSPNINKPSIEVYLRHLLMWPASVDVSLSDPVPGPIPGFYLMKIRGTAGGRSQDETFYVSADGGTIIHGDVLDLKKSPFQPALDLLKTDDQPFLGTPGAPVTVVEFSDFQCPFCREESSVIRRKLIEAYPKDVQLFFMDYPIEASHPFARGAAILGRCIYRQNNASFWDYHDWVFGNQEMLTAANFRGKAFDYAKGDKNLDMTKLTACALATEPRQEVDRSEAAGDALKIGATPTIYINGRPMVGAVSLEDLKTVIDHELAYAKTVKKSGDDCCSVQLALPGMAGSSSKSPAKTNQAK